MIRIAFSKYDTDKIVGNLLYNDGIAFSIKTASSNNPTAYIFIDDTMFTQEVYVSLSEEVGRLVLHGSGEPIYVENTDTGKKFVIDDLYNLPEYDEIMK